MQCSKLAKGYFFLMVLLCKTFLFAQSFAIEKNSYTFWDKKVLIESNQIRFNLNDYSMLTKEKCKIYSQISQRQYKELVYTNLGIIMTVRKNYLKRSLVFKKIEGITFLYRNDIILKNSFNRRSLFNEFFSSSINIYGQTISPFALYDSILGNNSKIEQYMDRSIYYDPKAPDKHTAVLLLDYFYVTLLFGDDEKLFYLNITTRS